MMRRVQAVTPTGAARLWLTLALCVGCVAVTIGFTITYVASVARRSEAQSIERARDICGLIVIVDDVNQQQPPPHTGNPTTDQKIIEYRAAVHAYRLKLGC